jgi:hypothetical protein
VGWPRRIGVALGILVLGASVALAGQALDGPEQPGGSPRGGSNISPTGGPDVISGLGPPAAPVFVTPAESATTATEIDLSGSLPTGLAEGAADRLRVYVNDELVRTRRLPRSTPFTLRDIPLVPGENRISATLSGPGGESARSEAVVIVRDSNEPIIVISAPGPDALLTAAQVTIRGRTEPLATVTVTNLTMPGDSSVEADAGGHFEAIVTLAMGPNEIIVASRDAVGNRGSARLDIVRSESLAGVALTVSNEILLLNRLPAELEVVATVHGELGLPVDDVVVFFSMSVPGQAATTYRATTVDGTAAWPGVRVPRAGTTKGRGRVTAQVTLPNGQQVAETASFSVR